MADRDPTEKQQPYEGLDRRVMTDAERKRKARFAELFASTEAGDDKITELFHKLRSPYTLTVGDDVLYRTGPTSTDENGYAKTTFTEEAIRSVHDLGGLTLAFLEITNVGALNKENGPDNVTHLLNETRSRVFRAYNREISHRKTSLEPARSSRIIPAVEFDGTGMQLFIGHNSSVFDDDQARFVEILMNSAQMGLASAVQSAYDTKDGDNVRLLHDLNSTDAHIKPVSIAQSNVEEAIIEAQAVIDGEDIEVELSRFEKGIEDKPVEIGHRSKRNYIDVDQNRREALFNECENYGVDLGALEELFGELGVHPRDELTGGLIRPDRTETIAQVAEQGNGTKTYYIEIDIGCLGGLNDTIGRSNANQIYTWIAQACQMSLDTLPIQIVPARLGGDEFGFFVSVNAATEESLKLAVEDLPLLVEDRLSSVCYDDAGELKPIMSIPNPKKNPELGIWRADGPGVNIVMGEYNEAARANPKAFFKMVGDAVDPLKASKTTSCRIIEFGKANRSGTWAARQPTISLDYDATRGKNYALGGSIPLITDPTQRGQGLGF